MAGILTQLRRAGLWVSALNADNDRDTDRTISKIRKIEALGELEPHHLALLGRARARAGEDFDAALAFAQSRELLEGKRSPDATYLRLYCDIFLVGLRSNDPVDDLIDEALSIDCRASTNHWFPLKKPPGTTSGVNADADPSGDMLQPLIRYRLRYLGDQSSFEW